MTTQTWKKACDCKGATATSGRFAIDDPQPSPAGFAFTVTWHFGPVCDSCDTPWKPVESEERSGELDEMETHDQWMRP